MRNRQQDFWNLVRILLAGVQGGGAPGEAQRKLSALAAEFGVAGDEVETATRMIAEMDRGGHC